MIEYVKTFAESFPLAKGGNLSAAQFLELFLFPPEKQYTHLDSLSGGEKKRLQLLSVLFTNPNFLVLDEPTNDLDLPTLAVLENFLSEYKGCLLIVSHDRYFMDRLVDHLFVFEGGGEIRDFPGNYTQYRIWLKENEKNAADTLAEANKQFERTTQQTATPKKKFGYKEKHEFETLEKEIADLEAEKQEIEERLSNPDSSFDQLNLFSRRIGDLNTLLEQKEKRWFELSELI